jgi:hypothetical protein
MWKCENEGGLILRFRGSFHYTSLCNVTVIHHAESMEYAEELSNRLALRTPRSLRVKNNKPQN